MKLAYIKNKTSSTYSLSNIYALAFKLFPTNRPLKDTNPTKNWLDKNFKKFKIEYGNVVWGKDWDMIFPVYDLYLEKIQGKE